MEVQSNQSFGLIETKRSQQLRYTRIDYKSYSNIFSELGGLFTTIKFAFTCFFSPVVYHYFEESLINQVTDTFGMQISRVQLADWIQRQKVLQRIKDRVSFRGIYGLYETIDSLKSEVKSMKLQIIQLHFSGRQDQSSKFAEEFHSDQEFESAKIVNFQSSKNEN